MIYSQAESALRALTGSSTRAKILLAIRDGPMPIRPLSGVVGASTSTVAHSIAAMREEICRDGGAYRLTNLGMIRAEALDRLLSCLIALDENAAFWQGHDISGIPASLLADIGLLSGGQCVQDNGFVMKSLDGFLWETSKAKHMWAVSPVIAPGHAELIAGLVEAGAEVHLILTSEIMALLDQEQLKSLLAASNFHLYQIDQEVKTAFTVADDMLSLGLYLPSGKYDTNQDLVCHGQAAVEWGMRLWEYYKSKATKID
ncbi:MAG: transcriptional regulator FilR1 domain-containing protein [Dehalococcoidia bacterium]